MAKDGGHSVGEVKTVGVSTSGKNWKIETDKGVMNFPKKNFPEMPGLSIGKKYYFYWNWFEIGRASCRERVYI